MHTSPMPASRVLRPAIRSNGTGPNLQIPLLNSLVEDALAHNTDLGVAAANLQAARAARRLAGFDQYPTVTVNGSYTHNLESAQQLPGVDRHDREFDTAQAGFDGLWELDLFGRVRRNVEAARGDLGASEATLRDARVSVIAEVARDYFILRGLQDQLAFDQAQRRQSAAAR